VSNGVINHFLKHCFVGIGQLKATPPALFAINLKGEYNIVKDYPYCVGFNGGELY